ncbi:MAG TPA: signal recognition particle-docking protein FtsY [Polyangiaceae bacterium]|nr:signal recognition particle-docking protein FtsY [Polyangiaceae bacterium]
MVYVLLAVVAVALVYFLFLRKSAPTEAAPPRVEPKVAPKRAESPKPATAPKEAPSATAAASAGAASAPSADASPPPPPSRKARESVPPPRAEVAAVPSAPPAPEPGEREVLIEGMRRGLAKSRESGGFFGRLRALIGGKRELDANIVSEIEEVLLTSDVGVETTQILLERVRQGLAKGELSDPEKVWDALRSEALKVLDVEGRRGGIALRGKPTVVLLVGVNGAGKTTTIGKLATKLQLGGHKVVLAAGDTFRAAAVQQLVVWGERVGCPVVRGKDGADPGSVVFDAIKKAQESGADVVLADTAGRLHTKTNLMTEMKKIAKTAEKALPDAPHEILLVMDATTGQNALAQAKEFKEALPLSGIVLTKLDGTAKGGVVIGVAHALSLPVRFVGLGERAEDLREFAAEPFVEALLGREAGGNGSSQLLN